MRRRRLDLTLVLAVLACAVSPIAADAAPPDRAALDKAIAAGQINTAAAQVTALLKATDNTDPELVYLGAEIAEQTGDQRTALTRYLAYARAVSDKSPKLDHALRFVLKREAYPEEYKKLVKVFGADELAWQYGLALLTKL